MCGDVKEKRVVRRMEKAESRKWDKNLESRNIKYNAFFTTFADNNGRSDFCRIERLEHSYLRFSQQSFRKRIAEMDNQRYEP